MPSLASIDMCRHVCVCPSIHKDTFLPQPIPGAEGMKDATWLEADLKVT